MYKVLLERQAVKFLKKLDFKNYHILSTTLRKLALFHEVANLDTKPLKGKFKGMMRLRVGSRRVLFTVDEVTQEIHVWIIEDRGDIY